MLSEWQNKYNYQAIYSKDFDLSSIRDGDSNIWLYNLEWWKEKKNSGAVYMNY